MSILEQYPENYDCRDPIQFAELELKLSGFADTAYGKAALEYIKETQKLAQNDINLVRQMHANIAGMTDQIPLAPILEEEFEMTEVLEFSGGTYIKSFRKQHKRIPFIHQRDGKYYDDRAVGFVNSDGMVWYGSNGKHRSSREIQLPYYRKEERVLVTNDDSISGNLSG